LQGRAGTGRSHDGQEELVLPYPGGLCRFWWQRGARFRRERPSWCWKR
jgi:hypothetical protein